MRCPYCAHEASQVKDSRPAESQAAIRRRRECDRCGARFTTFERVQPREIMVIKRDGRVEPFERAKLAHAVSVACRKRGLEPQRIDEAVSAIDRRIQSSHRVEITTQAIGEMVMEALSALDQVALVRFASVHHGFSDPADFATFASTLSKDAGP
jgi:transcriptional repressor NrdR